MTAETEMEIKENLELLSEMFGITDKEEPDEVVDNDDVCINEYFFFYWAIQQNSNIGKKYSEGTIKNYCIGLKSICKKLNLEDTLNCRNLFTVSDYKRYKELEAIIISAADFQEINKNWAHNTAGSAIKLYGTFLECFQGKLYLFNRIVFGAPGTGKSHILNEDAKSFGPHMERVTFHPDYTYANFVGTYKPVPEKDGDKKIITYKYVPGPFMRVLGKALKSQKNGESKPFLLLIEEINRANVAAVFGDVFQLLDRNKSGESEYAIATSEDMRNFLALEIDGKGGDPDNYQTVKIPSNMFIWATMNSADQGVFPMDTAFKRRWNFEYIDIDDAEKEMKDYKFVAGGKRYVWNVLRKAINESLTGAGINEDKLMGPFFISKDVMEAGEESLRDAIASKVIMYLFEDAAKQKKPAIFKDGKNKRYSKLVKEFETNGLDIFVTEITKDIKPIEDDVAGESAESEG